MTIILAEHDRPPSARAEAPVRIDARAVARADVDAAANNVADAHTDADLAVRAMRGEPGAFAALYQRHVEAVFHYFSFRVRDATVAEDLTHDVFVSALKAVRTLREPEKLVGWLMRIAHNRLANHWRASGRSSDPLSAIDGTDGSALTSRADHAAADPAILLDALTDAPRLTAALARLTPLQHDVVALRFVAGLSIAETAEAIGRTANAVKNVQHQALAKLRSELVSTQIA